MKRMKQVLSLLLVLVLVLSLVPTALADPPQEACREGGEHVWDVYEDTATCTQGGTRMYRCRKCGIWWREDSPALGHDWREGEVIESDGLLGPRRVRYVCDRCYEVKVETEQPTGGEVLNTFRNIPPDAELETDIIVVQQPEGGVLPDGKGASHLLTLEVEGGVPPYRYEWHAVDKGVTEYVDGNPVGYAVQSHSRRATEEANQRRAAFYEQYLNYTREHFGVEDVKGAMRGWTELQIREYGDLELGTYDEPDYNATIADCYYYCVIYDSAGDMARTENAFVNRELYIAVQPCNNDFRSGRCFLSCEAAGGSGEYSYTWYCGDLDHELSETGSTVEVFEPGEYFCVVRDGEKEITSRTVTVSEASGVQLPEEGEAPVITLQPGDATYEYYKASVDDDPPIFPITCKAVNEMGDDSTLVYEWECRSLLEGDVLYGDWYFIGEGSTIFAQSWGARFRCKVTDTRNGKYTYSREMMEYPKMTATKFFIWQPFAYYSPSLVFAICGGVGPYTIRVFQNRKFDENYPRVLIFEDELSSTTDYYYQYSINYHSYDVDMPYATKWYSYIWVDSDGLPHLNQGEATYTVEITDAAGQFFESDPFPMISDIY